MSRKIDLSRLNTKQRLALIEELWDSIDHANIGLSDAQKKELDRRLGLFNGGKTKLHSWNDIRDHLRSAE